MVGPKKEQAKLWFSIWHDNGRPDHGLLKDLMSKTKREYKRVSKWLIRNQDKISSCKMADALLSNRSRDFWDEVKRKGAKNSAPPAMVEGVQGSEAICDMFSHKYEQLYNCVSYDENEMNTLCNEIDDMVETKCGNEGECYYRHGVNVENVICAVKKMKKGKAEASDLITSDHIVNACPDLYIHLSLLFNVVIMHMYAPKEMLVSALVPIPKDKKKSLANSDNYRSIALSSIIGKLLDKIILLQHTEVFQTDCLQFGFKAKHSTNQCTFVLEEIVENFVNNGSSVYCILLDATRAFDRVQYVKMFRLLVDRGLCVKICKLLLSMYVQQSLVVKWNGAVSPPMSCSNGIKQGGVISPILFCIYMDELLKRLRSSGVGCHLGNVFVGALAYADDLTLLAPSTTAANTLISICEDFAREYHVKYNPTKSQMLIYNANCNASEQRLFLNGSQIQVVDSCKHLGVTIGKDAEKQNVERTAQDMVRRTNLLMSNYGYCTWNVLSSLFKSFCCHFYGCPLWCLNSRSIDYIHTALRKCCRRVLKLHPRTRSKYLHSLMNMRNFITQLYSRFMKFYMSCLRSSNPILTYVIKLSKTSFSKVGLNIRSTLSLLNISSVNLCDNDSIVFERLIKVCEEKFSLVDDEEVAIAFGIEELLNVRDCICELEDNFTRTDVEFLILALCVDT